MEEDQAIPINRKLFYEYLTKVGSFLLACGLWLQWKTVSRWDEVFHLNLRKLRRLGKTSFLVHFSITKPRQKHPLDATRRQIARGIGLVIWRTDIYGIPLITVREVMDVARKNSPSKPRKSQWDVTSPIDQPSRDALSSELLKIASDKAWHQWQDAALLDHSKAVRIASDSSSSKGAYVTFDEHGAPVKKWTWDEKMYDSCIFLKELLAATIAIENCCDASNPKPVHLVVDNTAARFVILRGLSTNSRANEMLARIYAKVPLQLLKVTHTRSCDNAADPLTRGLPLNETRNAATLLHMTEAEQGWTKTQSSPNFKPSDGEDGESDSDTVNIRHREGDESEYQVHNSDNNFDSEDEVEESA